MAEFRQIDEEQFRQAAARGAIADGCPRAISVRLDRKKARVVIALDTGAEIALDPQRIPGLEGATLNQLTDVSIEGVGSTLHFPKLDADFTVSVLIETFLGVGRQSARRVGTRAAE